MPVKYSLLPETSDLSEGNDKKFLAGLSVESSRIGEENTENRANFAINVTFLSDFYMLLIKSSFFCNFVKNIAQLLRICYTVFDKVYVNFLVSLGVIQTHIIVKLEEYNMDFNLTKEQELVRKALAEFTEAEVDRS